MRLLRKLALLAVLPLALLAPGADAGTTTPQYVQGNYATPQTPQSAVTVRYPAAQTAGNFNVVIVGWNDATSQITSLTDSMGNAYQLAVGPTVLSGWAPFTQYIVYAKNIFAATAGANAITITFNNAVTYPDVRILEYSGISSDNPLDVAVGSSGYSAFSNSGSVTTTNATDLLVGANTILTGTTGPGTGFTQRLLSYPDSDIGEDCVVTAIGSYSASAQLTSPGTWVMQMAAFRAANLDSSPSPVSSVTLAWNADPPTSDPATSPSGYRLYWGLASGNYTQRIDVGNNITGTISNPISGSTYYFAVTAYNSAGIEGLPSNEVSYTAP